MRGSQGWVEPCGVARRSETQISVGSVRKRWNVPGTSIFLLRFRESTEAIALSAHIRRVIGANAL